MTKKETTKKSGCLETLLINIAIFSGVILIGFLQEEFNYRENFSNFINGMNIFKKSKTDNLIGVYKKELINNGCGIKYLDNLPSDITNINFIVLKKEGKGHMEISKNAIKPFDWVLSDGNLYLRWRDKSISKYSFTENHIKQELKLEKNNCTATIMYNKLRIIN